MEISDRSRGKIQSRADSTLDRIPIEIRSESDDDGRGIYIVRVPEGSDKPYCTGGGRYLVRRNGQNSAISPTMMVQFLESRLRLAPEAVPFVHMSAISVELAPSVQIQSGSGEGEAVNVVATDLSKGRLSLRVDLTNLGAVAAQALIVDAEVHFKVRRPFDHDWLPTDTPVHLSYLGANPSGSAPARQQVELIFRKFLFSELTQDFFLGRRNWAGLPHLADASSMAERSLWPSPMLLVKCFYRDLHGQHFMSSTRSFFHIWPNREEGCLCGYRLHLEGTEDHRVVRVTTHDYEDRIPETRHLRYTAFYGEHFPSRELLLLRAASNDQE